MIKEDRELKAKLREVMNKAYKENKKTVFTKGRLFINGVIYRGPETVDYY